MPFLQNADIYKIIFLPCHQNGNRNADIGMSWGIKRAENDRLGRRHKVFPMGKYAGNAGQFIQLGVVDSGGGTEVDPICRTGWRPS
jgi:hypothetical protein